MQLTKRDYLSWTDVQQDTYALALQLQNQRQWKKVIAVTRGGLIPTAILVQYLNVQQIDTVCIATYTPDGEQSYPRILKGIQDDSAEVLVVDDLVDTGKTFKVLRQFLPNATYAAVYYKPKGKSLVDYAVKLIPQDVWVVFPWEDLRS
jgi:xanthine phosphoribosyltransferase